MTRRGLLSFLFVPLEGVAEGDRLLLETTQLLGVVSAASDKFSVVQQYLQQRTKVTAYIEGRYPGQTVDWTKLPATLTPK